MEIIKKNFGIILVVVIVVFIGAGIWKIYQINVKEQLIVYEKTSGEQPIDLKKDQIISDGDSPIEIQSEPKEIQVDTSNWKTYRNEKYGFEFKYPIDEGWKVFNDDEIAPDNQRKTFRLANFDFKYDPGSALKDNESIIYIQVDKTSETLEEISTVSMRRQKIIINGVTFIKINEIEEKDNYESGTNDGIIYITIKNGYKYSFEVVQFPSKNLDKQLIFNKLLSTIKFEN